MTLENITGNLLAYKELEPGTFQHSDQLTTARRTNHGLRNQRFYTADGELYTVQKNGHLWVITREPQNLVLQNIDEAYRQLIYQRNYFPDAEAAQASLDHKDSVVVDLNGLELVKGDDQHGHFVVDPKNVKKLNSEQRRAAQRIYGPDEENFGQNMEMFARTGKNPYIFVLMPDYLQDTLRSEGKEFLGLASWLDDLYYNSLFGADFREVYNDGALRGERRIVAEVSRKEVTNGAEQSDLSAAPKVAGKQPPSERSATTANIVIPFPQEDRPESSGVVALERMLETL